MFPGTIVARVSLVSNMAIDYKLVGMTSTFSISPAGDIRLLSKVDRETVSSYSVGVLASTRTNPPLSTLAEFIIQVTDINDNIPRFHSDNYTIALVENISEATSVFKGNTTLIVVVVEKFLYRLFSVFSLWQATVFIELAEFFQFMHFMKWFWFLMLVGNNRIEISNYSSTDCQSVLGKKN